MKKSVYLILLLILSLNCNAQTLFRSGIFLHHSTGGNIWGPNGSSTSIPLQIPIYNSVHGYTGTNAVTMHRLWWPGGGNNEWEYWHRIFDNQAPESNILPILAANKIVVIKSCYPSSEISGMGQPSDTLTYAIKSIYNYKWHWRNIVNVMAQHPDNFFVIWTNAPLVPAHTNPTQALRAKNFCKWAKDTLAMGLDPVMGAFPPNIYVFDYFSKLTDANGYQQLQYAVSSSDSHPNATATELVAPQFVTEIFDAAIAYEQGGTILSVSPANRSVAASSGSTTFAVTSNTSWTTQSNAGWCSVTPSGNGNGTIIANYSANTGTTNRTATITVSATGGISQTITVTQAGVQNKILNIDVLIEGLYAGGGTLNHAFNDIGPFFGSDTADMVTIELHNAVSYSIIEYTNTGKLSTSGEITISLPSNLNGNYYITIKHRNSLETTSSSPVSFSVPLIAYSFNLPQKAYGGNLVQMFDGYYAIYSGDVNQDGVVDTGDFSPVDYDQYNFVSGYVVTDINGDGTVDTADLTITDNNVAGFIWTMLP